MILACQGSSALVVYHANLAMHAVASKKCVSVSSSLETTLTSTSHNSISETLNHILSGQTEFDRMLFACYGTYIERLVLCDRREIFKVEREKAKNNNGGAFRLHS